MARRLASLAWRITYARYLMASVVALGADVGCYMGLLRLEAAPVPAALAGYMFGLLIHWLLSSRYVFATHKVLRGADRARQKALFVGSAFVGLGLTGAIVGIGHGFGLDPLLAKLAAVGVSFQATYLLRRSVVFA